MAGEALPPPEERAKLPPDGGRSFNALIHETSPYLLQHARNPVDWLPWGEAAFHRAREEGKPVFLSIGYSTCHWCHVMAHESFEDGAVAAALRRDFIAVKVDREERPDVDGVHMAFVQATTGSGGWPLSVWLTPDGRPFTGTTYLPRKDLLRVLATIARAWHEDPAGIEAVGARVQTWLREQVAPGQSGDDTTGDAPLVGALAALAEDYDTAHGGFGGAPKFPQPAWLVLLRDLATRGGDDARPCAMLDGTLAAIAAGGIHDQLAGGFHRYAVDRRWRVPHFEKMLYDQAQLVDLLLDAARLVQDGAGHEEAARRALDFVLAELTHPDGGFHAALDADSPDQDGTPREGAFYVWEAAEFRAVAGRDADAAARALGVEAGGNVDPGLDPRGELRGHNVLHLTGDAAVPPRALAALRARRDRRPRPHRDDKVVTAWNGLMLGAFARAAAALGEDRYRKAAARAAAFLYERSRDPRRRRLRRSWNGVPGGTPGMAVDYACLVAGLLDLVAVDDDPRWVPWLLELEAAVAADCWDDAAGGYFADDGGDPHLAARLKDAADGAVPSANGLMARNLLRLHALTGEPRFRERAGAVVRAFTGTVEGHPLACPLLVLARDDLDRPAQRLVLVGRDRGAAAGLGAVAARRVRPGLQVLLLTERNREVLIPDRPDLAAMTAPRSGAVAHFCRGSSCDRPTADPEALVRLLDGAPGG